MKIYNSTGVEIYDIVVDDKSYSYRALLEISSLTLYFSSPEFIDIPLGAYCEFQGQTFYLENPSNFKKNGTRNFEYTLILEESWAQSRRYKLKNIADGRLKFSLTAKPSDHLKLIVDNMNLRDTGWTVGDCVDSPDKTISYNHIYCKDALQMVADEFQTEWEIVGKVIHLRKIEYYKDAPLALSYGKGNGFKTGLGRTNLNDSRPVEVLYVQGGERNIDYSKYGAKELLLPKNQQLVYQGRTYESDAAGLSIYRADKPVQFNNEDSLDLSHIYPSRVGTVSSVIVVDADKHFYDFIDASIPADLDYNDCRIAGEKAVVIFQSGILAGREFEIEQTEDALTGYVHAERRFKLVPQEMDGVTMPDETFKPAAGDKYAVFGISLPDAYVCDNVNQEGGSWDMFREAAKYLFENEDLKFSFTGELDGIWAKQNWLVIGGKIKPGGFVSFSDTQFQTDGILIRQISAKQFVNNPYSPVIELSNAPAPSGIGSTLKKISVNEVVTENLNKETIRYAKRGFRDTKQTAEMLANAMVYYGKAINPVTIQTMALMVGDESLQFRFVDDKTTPVAVAHNVQFNSTTKVLNSPAGIIQHMTLGIDSLSSSHALSEYKFWDLTAYDSPAMDQPDKSYYLYAKVSKSAQTGVFLLSEPPIGIEEVTDYYHLLVGILNSENDEGDRSYVDLYGYSELLPGRFTISKIVSPDGNIVIDLTTGVCELQGVFSFSAGSAGYQNLTDKPDLSQYPLESEVNTLISGLQAQIDGSITTWFYAYAPTISNAPASGWTTTALKDAHLGDLFYDTVTGYAYRYQKVGTVYSWQKLSDSDISAALAVASTAQDTADGKRRVFVATPTTPYDIGDLWMDGATGSAVLKRCQTARASGAYVAGDWIAPLKYTDDTTANAAAAAAAAAQTDADAALTNITNIISDNVLSGAEKPGQRMAWNIVAAEKSGLNTQASTFSITTENTNYNNAFQALATYLNNGTTWSSGVPTWLADANLSTNTTIVGSTYRTNWANLYAARTTLLNAIATKAKTLADSAQSTANSAAFAAAAAQTTASNAQTTANTAATNAGNAIAAVNIIVSDNYLSAAEKPSQRQAWNIIQAEKSGINSQATAFGITTENTAYNTAFQTLSTYLNAGTTWSSGIPSWLADANLGTSTSINGTTYRTNWTNLYSARTTLLNAIATKAKQLADTAQSSVDSLDYLKQALSEETSIAGGLMSTSLIKLGATNQAGQWVERAGINGISGNDNTPSYYSGGTLQQAVQRIAGDIVNGAKTVITAGGKIFAKEVELFGSIATSPSGKRIHLNQSAGSVDIYDETDEIKTSISSIATPSLASLLATDGASVAATKSATASGENTTNTQYTASITLPSTSSNYTITTPPIVCACSAVSAPYSGSDSFVIAYLETPNGDIILGSLSANANPIQTSVSNQATIPVKVIASMPAGVYRIRLVASTRWYDTGASGSASISIVSPDNILSGISNVSVSRIFKDGLFIITDINNYLYVSPTTFESRKGTSIIRHTATERTGFGIIISARVTASNVITNIIGTVASVTNNGSGLYTITHNLGHTNYTISANPFDSTANRHCNIPPTGLGANSCQVQFYNGSTAANMGFMIDIKG